MTVLKGRRIAGKAWLISAGIAPLQATAFTVSLSAASGLTGTAVTATVTPFGGTWAPAQIISFGVVGLAGSFSAANVAAVQGTTTPVVVTFTPTSTAPTSGTINVSSPGLTNQSGPQSYTITVATATGYTLTQPNPSGVTGQANPLTVSPSPQNSVWPAGLTITLAETAVAGAFSPAAALHPTANSSAPVATNWTPSATGTAVISATNSASLTNPGNLTYAVSAASGSSATLTANSSFDSKRVFNRDVYTGNPPSLSTTYGKGWGAVPVSVTPSAAGATGMWMRLHDASDPQAISGSPGTGALLQPAVQVAGVASLSAGANTVSLTIPAGLVWFYADLALKSDMSNAVRIATPFGVGSITVLTGTSHMGSFMNPFQYDPTAVPPVSQLVNLSPFGVIYAPSNAYVNPTPNPSSWDVPGDVAGAANNPANDTHVSIYNSPAVAEYLRLSVQQLGVVCAVVAAASYGGNTLGWNPDDTSSFHQWGVFTTALNRCGYKFDAFLSIQGANDYGWGYSRAFTTRMLRDVQLATMDASAAAPFAAVLCTTPVWGGNDQSTGFRQGMLANRDVAAGRASALATAWSDSGAVGSNLTQGHSTPMGRIRFARNFYRDAMGLLGTAKGGFTLRQGPQIVSAVRNGVTITCTVQHDGGTALVPYSWLETNPATCTAMTDGTASGQQLGILFAIYNAGNSHNYVTGGNLALDATAPVTIVNATTIQVKLAADPGASAPLDLWYGMDPWGQWPVLGQAVPCIKDNTSDSDGITYGRDLRRTIDPIFVTPASPAAQAIALNTPADTAAGAWIMLGGPSGTGLPLGAGCGLENETDLVEVSIAGGAYASARALVRNDNAWGAMVQAPGSAAAGVTIAVRRAGQTSSDANTTFNVVTARNTLPSSIRAAAVAMYDASNIGTIWQDAAMTTPAAQLQPVRAWQDALGTSSNTVLQVNSNAGYAPFLDKRIRNEQTSNPSKRDDVSAPRPCLNFYRPSGPSVSGFNWGRSLSCKSPALASLTGDCTVLAVCRWEDGGVFALGKAGASPNYGTNGLAGGNLMMVGGIGLARSGAASGYAQATASGVGQARMDFVIGRYTAATGVLYTWKKGGTTATATLADTSAATFDTLIIGAYFSTFIPTFQTVRVHELTFFNVAASDSQITDLAAYAQAKWGNG